MIPVIQEGFSRKYKTAKFVREFNSGNGISDLSFALLKDDFGQVKINNYNEMFYLVRYFSRINELVNVDEIKEKDNLDRKTFKNLVQKLLNSGHLVPEIGGYMVKKKYSSSVRKLISIEAKLSKWKDGFYQALRYQCFSHKSYLALSSDKIKNVDFELFKQHNIGLISVSKSKIKIEIEPLKDEPKDTIAYYHSAENMIASKQNRLL